MNSLWTPRKQAAFCTTALWCDGDGDDEARLGRSCSTSDRIPHGRNGFRILIIMISVIITIVII
eukprot:3249083-Karenia_brevis.AAC.1